MTPARPIIAYLQQVAKLLPNARSKERAYRSDLQNLLGQLLPSLTVIHEPAGVDGGAPDFLIENRDHAALCYLETKDIGTDLAFGLCTTPHDREQFERYRSAFTTLIYTDYLTFRFYRGGVLRDEIRIADVDGLKLTPLPDACRALAERLTDFTATLEPVKTAACLADKQRLRIYLTNTLEPHGLSTGTLFDDYWVAQEVRQADAVKRDTPVMVVLGNPPYSGESANKSDWIMGLMEDYKKEPGGKDRLNERNPKWVNDDYVKFIRFAESLIERTREGIVAFINNHGFLDNPTFRGMRWRLLSAFG